MAHCICRLCPRACGGDRVRELGVCGGGAHAKIARAALHLWEEPCISYGKGSGAVFFSGCALQCVFCQNAAINTGQRGKEVSPEQLSDIFLRLADNGAQNINLVTPSHYAPW